MMDLLFFVALSIGSVFAGPDEELPQEPATQPHKIENDSDSQRTVLVEISDSDSDEEYPRLVRQGARYFSNYFFL